MKKLFRKEFASICNTVGRCAHGMDPQDDVANSIFLKKYGFSV